MAARSRRMAPHALAATVLALALVVVLTQAHFGGHDSKLPATNDVHAWAPPGSKPLNDRAAAALVTPDRETVRGNAAANAYVPSHAQLLAFRSARTSDGTTMAQFNPLVRHVTGRPGIAHPSTDELIQWTARKWGIPTDWLRAQLVVESHWRMSQRGDRAGDVYQSLGIAQVKWLPDGSVGAGTEPLRRLSTAFNLDYFGATLRYYYDGLCHWCAPGYRPGDAWNSIGAWFSPEPWANSGARHYIGEVRRALARRAWNRL